MNIKSGVFLIIGIFLINFVSASFSVGNSSHYIETQYSPSEKVYGWMNISLENEPSDSLIADSEGNSIMLMDLFKQDETLDYSCSTQECINDYSTDGTGKSEMSFSLASGQKKIVGLKLGGEITSISSLHLELTSDATSDCYSQVKVDILNDGSTDFMNEKELSTSSCTSLLTRGCFDSSRSSSSYLVGKFPNKHCQRINLSSSPGFMIGAWINNQTNDPRKITMGLYNLDLEEIEGLTCNLPAVSGSGYASCKISYPVKDPTPYYVCIYSDKIGTAKVRGYNDKINGCGFYQQSENNPDENSAFDISVQGVSFNSVGKITISDSSEETMGKIKDYLYSQYESYDCNENDCIIPVLITSQKNQNIVLKNLKLDYVTNMGETEANELYSLKIVPPKITSNFQKIFLEYGNFSVSDDYGEETFTLKLNGKNIFSEEVEIRDFPRIIGISPTTAPSFIPTTFKISTASGDDIISYFWDFNDSTEIQKTTTNKTTHTYNASGVYNITITVQDSEEINVSKNFEILATIPEEQVESTLERDLEILEGLKKQISAFDLVVQKGLNSVLKIEELEKNLKDLQKEYTFASTEEDYIAIMENLSRIDIPEIVLITKKAPLFIFYPLEDQIDLDTLKTVGGGDYNSEQTRDYQNAILGWQMENTDVRASMEEFSASIDGEAVPVLTNFMINVKKNNSEKPVYLFVKKMEGLNFKEKYFEKESGDYYYWILEENEKTIEFSTSEIMNYEELPVFISPEISTLLIEPKDITPVTKNWGLKIAVGAVSLAILFFIATIIYSMLSVWYKRKYESYLFKNRNDLYNLISYVHISNKKGEKEADMRVRLKKAGWSGEQITYVLKKYSGKRTGMIELPLTKLVDRLLGKYEKPNLQHPRINPMGRPFRRPF
jgi:PKD repeat protein